MGESQDLKNWREGKRQNIWASGLGMDSQQFHCLSPLENIIIKSPPNMSDIKLGISHLCVILSFKLKP